jgi:hypothetical protein
MDKFKKMQALQAAVLLLEDLSSYDLLTKYGLDALAINTAKNFLRTLDAVDGN